LTVPLRLPDFKSASGFGPPPKFVLAVFSPRDSIAAGDQDIINPELKSRDSERRVRRNPQWMSVERHRDIWEDPYLQARTRKNNPSKTSPRKVCAPPPPP
jgi:hypothetical protein